MHDEQLGWAVGHDETILRTRDGGAHLGARTTRPRSRAAAARRLVRRRPSRPRRRRLRRLLATSDGGDTWEPRSVHGDDDFHLNQIAAAADGTLYLAAEAGHLYRSDDGGETWQPLPSPYEGSFFGLLPLARRRAAGLRPARPPLPVAPIAAQTWTAAGERHRGHADRRPRARPGAASWWRASPGRCSGATARTARSAGRTCRTARAVVALARGDERSLLLFGEGGVRRVEIAR